MPFLVIDPLSTLFSMMTGRSLSSRIISSSGCMTSSLGDTALTVIDGHSGLLQMLAVPGNELDCSPTPDLCGATGRRQLPDRAAHLPCIQGH
jgi:hypothetical protein